MENWPESTRDHSRVTTITMCDILIHKRDLLRVQQLTTGCTYWNINLLYLDTYFKKLFIKKNYFVWSSNCNFSKTYWIVPSSPLKGVISCSELVYCTRLYSLLFAILLILGCQHTTETLSISYKKAYLKFRLQCWRINL